MLTGRNREISELSSVVNELFAINQNYQDKFSKNRENCELLIKNTVRKRFYSFHSAITRMKTAFFEFFERQLFV